MSYDMWLMPVDPFKGSQDNVDKKFDWGKAASVGLGGLNLATQVYGDVKDIQRRRDFDPNEYIQMDTYNPYVAPSPYTRTVMPEDIMKGTGGRAMMSDALKYGSTGASIGSAFGPLGTAIGAGVGALGGVVTGAIKGEEARRDRDEFNRIENLRRLNYDKAVNNYWNTNQDQRMMYAQMQEEGKRDDYLPSYGSNIYQFI